MISFNKSIILSVALCTALLASCDSAAKKEEKAEANVQEANKDLKVAQNNASVEAQKNADAEEWKNYKAANQAEITANETRIKELREQLKQPGMKHDHEYANKINDLEDRNKALQKRIDTYDNAHSDWAAFKRDFTHDVNELGQSLKDFSFDKKK